MTETTLADVVKELEYWRVAVAAMSVVEDEGREGKISVNKACAERLVTMLNNLRLRMAAERR